MILLFAGAFVFSAAGLVRTLRQADRENEAFKELAALTGEPAGGEAAPAGPAGAGDPGVSPDGGSSNSGGSGDGSLSGGTFYGEALGSAMLGKYLGRDFTAVAGKNPDFAAWLAIPGMRVDYPVMLTPEDPQFYIHRDFNGETSASGCLFMGEGCTADSESIIVYGHNMKNGSMFGSLENYADGKFGREHPYIVFSVPSEDRIYEVFAAFKTRLYGDGETVFHYYRYGGDLTEERFEELMEGAEGLSLYGTGVSPEYGDRILMLSTCSYQAEDGRFVVAAREIHK